MKLYFQLFFLLIATLSLSAQDGKDLAEALRGETPILEDLHELCDQIGGRVTGTSANEASVLWAARKLQSLGVKTWTEKFEMPRKWYEKSATATVRGGSNWKPRIACRAFSTGTPEGGLEAELIYVKKGSTKSFEAVKDQIEGNYVLVETPVMTNLTELFLEYINAVEIENNAKKYGAIGVVYMSSRAKKLLYRHLTSYGIENDMPMIVMARDDATRCRRLLKRGKKLKLNLELDVVDEGAYMSETVFAEIPGSEKPEEVVIIGAHLDSWGLGTGANDNGCNVTMMMDILRQMKNLGLQAKRTVRVALWNGEEQGMLGSYAYTQQHKDELDQIKMTITVDIGSGNIDGFFVNGRKELLPFIEEMVAPMDSMYAFEHTDGVIVGTDNYDFFAQGVPNIVAKHGVHNYCEDYHSESDTYDKVSQLNLKRNAMLIGWVTWQFANDTSLKFKRHKRKTIQSIIEEYELESGMEALRLLEGWNNKTRGIER